MDQLIFSCRIQVDKPSLPKLSSGTQHKTRTHGSPRLVLCHPSGEAGSWRAQAPSVQCPVSTRSGLGPAVQGAAHVTSPLLRGKKALGPGQSGRPLPSPTGSPRKSGTNRVGILSPELLVLAISAQPSGRVTWPDWGQHPNELGRNTT